MAQQQQRPTEPFDREPGREPDFVRGPFPGMATPSVAADLRDARLGLGQDLRDIASALRIRHDYLQAIEEERFGDLPGPAYVLGFVRAYAGYLGLDREEVMRRFKEQGSGLRKKTDLVFPEPLPESRIPRGAILLISAMLVLAAYGGWYYLSAGDMTISEIIPKVPDRLAHLVSGEKQDFPVAEAVSDDEAGTAAATASALDTGEPAGRPATADPPARAQPPAQTPEAAAPGQSASPSERAAAPESAAAVEPEPSNRPSAGARMLPAEPTVESRAGPVMEGEPASRPDGVDRSEPAGRPATEDSPASAQPPAQTAEPTAGSRAGPVMAAEPASRPDGVDRSEPAETAPAPPESAAAAVPAMPLGPQQTESQPRQGARVYGEDHEDSRVIVRAKHDSWIQVRNNNNTLLLTRILRAGDSYRVPNRKGLKLMTGNAGALEILVDGESVPPIGPFGAVRRDVPLDVDRLRAAAD